MQIAECTVGDFEDWAQLRDQLWPKAALHHHLSEIEDFFRKGSEKGFIARNQAGEAIGFAEASLRHDYVNGCSSSPVLFLEGIYVRLGDRRHGVAQALGKAVADWGRNEGCKEFASDASLGNSESHSFHAALGFEETERVVFFRRQL